MVGDSFVDENSVMNRRVCIGGAGRGITGQAGVFAQHQEVWRVGSFHFGSRQSSLDTPRYGAVARSSVLTRSKFKILAMAGIAGLGGFCSQSVESEEVADHADRPSDQGEGGFGINIFGLSLHTDRSAGHTKLTGGGPALCVRAASAALGAVRRNQYLLRLQSPVGKYVALGTSYASPNAGALELPLLTDKVEATTMESRSSP
jgi:hypothetical protein